MRFSDFYIIIVRLQPRSLRLILRGLATLKVSSPRRLNNVLKSRPPCCFIVLRNYGLWLRSDAVLPRRLVGIPSAALPNRRRSLANCSDAQLCCASQFNTNLPRLVGNLSSKRSLNMSFDEAAKVESLLKGMMDAQLFAFWLLSTLLHWLKELSFVSPDSALFAQLIQSLSLSLVSASTSSCALASYMQAKRREGVLSHFPSHVGTHFRRDLAAASFAGTFLLIFWLG